MTVNKDGSLLPIKESCEKWNLGRNTLVREAKKAGALVRIGPQILRINTKIMNEYFADMAENQKA